MLENINQLDTQLFLFINRKHNSFFDPIMYWASDKLFWIPFYTFLLYIIMREFKKKSAYVLLAIAFLITICDQTASHLIKNAFKRLRPSHEPSLENLIHLRQSRTRWSVWFYIVSLCERIWLSNIPNLFATKKI